MKRILIAAVLAPVLLSACERARREPPLFEALDPAATGVTFVNALPEDTAFNIIDYLYYYNGGGVAAGDVNGDGLPDLYFTSNRGSDRLYLNRGDYRFEDVTERAGVADSVGWKTGVTMADVDGDGHLDIYVSGVDYRAMRGRNVLYVNRGDGTFDDRTEEFGLGHVGYGTQALFFDYDGDGDLDAYLLNGSTHTERAAGGSGDRRVRNPRAGDRLLRNDDGRFVDVSEEAGIYGGVDGYGLGVVASDVNLDGCPDLYVANDFQENDFLYLNDCDGTFTESIATATGHTSRFSMGVDAADYDNDLRPDVIVVDMMPEREEILKTAAGAESFSVFDMRVRAGYHPQYSRNTLQLGRGGGRFSEVGFLAGVAATDWSWAPLFADLDNDGRKDLFVTNGIYRRPNDLDYIEYVGHPAVQASLARGVTGENLPILQKLPHVPIPNAAYRNRGDLTFTSAAEAWGLAEPGFSSGAVYVDLNNSGALDLVVSNVNAPASIYRNRARERNGHHFLRVELRGEGANTAGIGARVIVEHGGARQVVEQMPTRGFQSSVDPRPHFGLGASTRVDRLTVIWPDRRFQVLEGVPADTTVTLRQRDAAGRFPYDGTTRPASASGPSPAPLFSDETARLAIDYRHRENAFYDFNRQPLMPHQLSREGPALAAGDVDGDGLDDLYVGGAKWQPGRLLLQQPDGSFRPGDDSAFRADSTAEDVDAAFFDANGDGRLDLYVVSGGNEFQGEAEPLLDRLYVNDGNGRFHRDRAALPALYGNGSTVAPADFDGDGHVDLFVGGRAVAGRYGLAPRSHLLRNDGRGRFTDVTATLAPGLAEVGMVTSAAWTDQNRDGHPDLVVVGDWMPVRVFRQEAGRFVERGARLGLSGSEGWWNTVTAADIDGDGRDDLVLGNLGLNSYVRASAEEPARLYVGDFAGTGGVQQLLTFYKGGVSYPMVGRDELVAAIPRLRERYPTYASFGASRLEDVFRDGELRRAEVREARVLASSVALAQPDGTYRLEPLPQEAQLSPVRAVLPGDFDADGRMDVLVAGNFDGVTPLEGRYDASYGLLLRGRGDGRFEAADMQDVGLCLLGQVRHLRLVRAAGGGHLLVAARNDDALQVLRPLRLRAAREPARATLARPGRGGRPG